MTDCNDNFPNCSLFYENFSYCLKPTAQYDNIYKNGTVINCNEYLSDWKKCLYAKTLKNENEIKELYEASNYYLKSKEVKNDIFEYKKNPSWYSS